MLRENGEATRLQEGDRLHFDVDNHAIIIKRNGKPLTNDDGSEYSLMPSDGVEFDTLAQLIADVAGLKVKATRGKYVFYRQ